MGEVGGRVDVESERGSRQHLDGETGGERAVEVRRNDLAP